MTATRTLLGRSVIYTPSAERKWGVAEVAGVIVQPGEELSSPSEIHVFIPLGAAGNAKHAAWVTGRYDADGAPGTWRFPQLLEMPAVVNVGGEAPQRVRETVHALTRRPSPPPRRHGAGLAPAAVAAIKAQAWGTGAAEPAPIAAEGWTGIAGDAAVRRARLWAAVAALAAVGLYLMATWWTAAAAAAMSSAPVTAAGAR